MHYTTSGIDYGEDSRNIPETDTIDIGESDENVTRWWYAILARNEGWKAIVKRTPKSDFLAPWAVSRTCETCFTISQKIKLSNSLYTPLTSDEAFEALAKFALLHGLGSQFPIALMTAVTFPTHQYYGSTVQLPFPRATGGKQPTAPMDVIPSIWSSQRKRYLTT
ncbi:uncharacterized protein N7479_010640 [Penicillium vulpinum]|nr:uncharacterized protein N7479_010640 [Penicillium vulpinum]KAJ5952227.1 hypothetical protein N7479_010640 [Penicillium vulpinum]